MCGTSIGVEMLVMWSRGRALQQRSRCKKNSVQRRVNRRSITYSSGFCKTGSRRSGRVGKRLEVERTTLTPPRKNIPWRAAWPTKISAIRVSFRHDEMDI